MSKDHDRASHGSQDARRHKINDQTRDQWLDRDNDLQAAWRASGLSREEFIRQNQRLIDKAIGEAPDWDR
ncbi:hypothetical protein [Rhizobium sp. BK602]|uniref:hypothetical protein n=1 Tax=Rhizobium sp. BK602 TaxID=2586986 RepID=UPI0016074651|nr:hypothetical protein [Rhizobium sp. BK602]MBB3612760.1 hypothetical protein [Rhizobium sp. BK602]